MTPRHCCSLRASERSGYANAARSEGIGHALALGLGRDNDVGAVGLKNDIGNGEANGRVGDGVIEGDVERELMGRQRTQPPKLAGGLFGAGVAVAGLLDLAGG